MALSSDTIRQSLTNLSKYPHFLQSSPMPFLYPENSHQRPHYSPISFIHPLFRQNISDPKTSLFPSDPLISVVQIRLPGSSSITGECEDVLKPDASTTLSLRLSRPKTTEPSNQNSKGNIVYFFARRGKSYVSRLADSILNQAYDGGSC